MARPPRIGGWYSISLSFALTIVAGGGTAMLDAAGVAEAYDSLSVIALALMGVAWWAVRVFRHAAKIAPSPIASERADVALRDAVVVSLVGLLAVRRLTGFPIPPELITAGLLLALFAAGIYAVRLLVWYYRGEFES